MGFRKKKTGLENYGQPRNFISEKSGFFNLIKKKKKLKQMLQSRTGEKNCQIKGEGGGGLRSTLGPKNGQKNEGKVKDARSQREKKRAPVRRAKKERGQREKTGVPISS